jgi:voltage-gated potassium channel Kch
VTYAEWPKQAFATVERTLAVMAVEPRPELRHSSWEIFVLALSVVSLTNIVLLVLPLDDDSKNVILIVDGVLCLVFLSDFVYRLRAAESKREYMFRGGGGLDLIGSLPFPAFRLARAYRVVRATIVIRAHGGRRVWRDFIRERAQGAMYVVLLLVVLVLEYASIGVLAAERGAGDENIRTASDALWWGYVTITTVGYGDRFPVTTEGRIVGVVLLTVGVGLFGTFTAFIANVFLAPRRRRTPTGRRDTFAELRALLDEHERTAAQLRNKLEELERGASQPAPP